jgi:hypothetical protein
VPSAVRGTGGDFRFGHDRMHDMLDIDGIHRVVKCETDPSKPPST